MIKSSIFVILIAVFSCNNTTSDQQQVSKSKSNLEQSCSLPTNVSEISTRINADKKIPLIAEFFKKRSQLAGFNGNVLIAQEGVILYQQSFGYAQIEKKDSLLPNSKFQLASLSKTFTGIAALKLVEQGKIKLDDDVRLFIPQFPYEGIQIKSLLSHRSGLPYYGYVLTDSVRKRNPYPNNADIIRWLCAVKPKPYNKPNLFFSYSNTNYSLLASIIEKVSGLSFEKYLQENIFKPLAMNDTWLVTTKAEAINQNRTAGYQYRRRLGKDNFDDVVGDKGVYSTTSDLFKWYWGLANNCILRPETMQEAFSPRSFERKGIKNYGYGFRMHTDVADPKKAKYVYHTGWWKGYNSLLWFSPTDKFVIIVLSNRYDRGIYNIKPLLEILHDKAVDASVEEEMF